METGTGTDSQDGWRQEQERIVRMDGDSSRDRYQAGWRQEQGRIVRMDGDRSRDR